MAKKTDETKITKEQIRTGGVFMDMSSFNQQKGETYAGLNILKLNPNEAAGPITIKDILLNQKLGKDGAAKKRKPVDVYVGEHEGITLRLPVAASFIAKAKEAKLSIGDVIAVARGEDYKSQFNTRGATYLLKVLSRANAKK